MAAKPNFKPYGNKKSGKVKDAISGVSKKVTSRTHHDSVKGNGGNGGGKRR